MAYYLRSLAANDSYATIPTVTLSGDFEITIVATQATNGCFLFAGDGVSGNNGLDLYRNNSSKYQMYINTSGVLTSTANATSTFATPDTIVIRRVGTTITLLVNGVSQGTATSAATLRVDRLFHRPSWGTFGNMALYSFTVSGGSYSTAWNASNSPSSGTTWTSTNGQVMTEGGTWQSGEAEWVFYSSGGTAYADLLNGATFSSSIGTLASSTAHNDVLSGVSYTSSVNSLNATRGYGDMLSGLTYSASVGQLDATRGYSSLLVGGSYAYAVGNLESTNTSATGRDDALQGVSLSLAVGSLVSTVQRNTTLAGLSYTSAVGNLSASLAYNSALLGLTYSASVNTLLHTWSGEVTVTIEGYTIRYADSIVAAAYANDIISAGYAADILERITWQH